MSNSTCNANIYAPIIACLSQALLMSVVINIYWICLKRNRELGQRCYNLVTCYGTRRTMQQDGRIEEQTESENDVQYAAVDFLKRKETIERKKTETDPGEVSYSGVENFDLETCRSTHRTIEQDAQIEMQAEAENNVQYAAVNFLKQKENTERKKTKTESEDILYSGVENFGWE